jgi:hypothetical protein
MFNQARTSEDDALRFGCKMDGIGMVGGLVMVRWEAVSQLLRLVAVAHRNPPGTSRGRTSLSLAKRLQTSANNIF